MSTAGNLVCHDHVALRQECLKPTEMLTVQGQGLLILFPKGGSGEWRAGKDSQALAPGGVLVMNATTSGSLRATDGDSLPFSYFSLGLEHIWALCSTHELCVLQTVLERLKVPRVHPGTSPIAQKCHTLLKEVPPEPNFQHRSQLLRVAATVLSVEFQEALPPPSAFLSTEEHMLQVLAELSVTDLMNLPVDELATKFKCGRRQLNRLFQRYFGKSASSLRMEMRLLRAAALLRDPKAKVTTIAEECGFNHLGLFNTCFKRRFEVSPSQWRQKSPEAADHLGDLLVGHPGCQLRAQGLCAWAEG